MKYRTKSSIIEAILWTGDNVKELNEFIKDIDVVVWKSLNTKQLKIYPIENNIDKTINDYMIVVAGDYIIKSANGEVYSCTPNIFEKIYDEVKEDD